jgi:hypothetical protein
VDSQKDETNSTEAENQRPSEKRLARGLEDVSHLFLSQSTAGTVQKDTVQGPSREENRTRAAPLRTPFILRPSQALNRELLISLLNKNTAVLEEGMQGIDLGIPCKPFDAIDLLAVDEAEQLAIIDVDTEPNNDLILRGIAHYDWFIRNTPIVRRMYHGRVINFSAQPRLFLIAPSFSPLLMCAARRCESFKICCFVYHAVSMSGGTGVFFERA